MDRLTGEVGDLATDNDGLTSELAELEKENAQLGERIEGLLADIDSSVVSAPDLEGGTAAAAASQAEQNGWVVVQIPSATTEVAPGTVLSQTPGPGTPMLSGSALVISVAAAPEPPPEPEPGIETVFEADGSGSQVTGTVDLEPGARHALAYSFTGPGRHVVTVVDADDDAVAQLVDVNGTAEGATALPLVGSYRLSVTTDDQDDWTLRVVTLP